MSKKRRQFSSSFKAKVGLEALKGTKTIAQISSDQNVHPNQISKWKKHLRDNMSTLFDKESGSLSKVDRELIEQEKAPLLQEIGDLTIQLKWLKKKHDSID